MDQKANHVPEKSMPAVQRVEKEAAKGGEAQIDDKRPATLQLRKLRAGISSPPPEANTTQLRTAMQEATSKSPIPIQRKANRTGLPDQLKSGIENLSGYAMDDVKVHYNSSKPAQLQAHAYAQGTNIHLAPGQEKHLPHEAWHVVQQKQGRVQPTRQLKSIGVNINDDAGLEKEADVMGAKALRQTPTQEVLAQRMEAPNQDMSVVQGKFGLEAELDVHLSTAPNPAAANGAITHPACASYPVIAEGDGFEVHIDHSFVQSDNAYKSRKKKENNQPGQNAIIELITNPPFDENRSWEEVEAQLDNMLTFIDEINGDFSRKDLSTFTTIRRVTEGYGRTVFVGGTEVAGQSLASHLHITAGVDLKKITRYFSEVSDKHDPIDPEDRRANKAKIFKDVTKSSTLGDKFANEEMEGASDGDKKEIAGLIALLASYMLAGKNLNADSDLTKNKLGAFFYKSPIIDVRQALSATNKKRMSGNFKRSILAFLFRETKVERNARIYGTYSYETWVKDVLSVGFGRAVYRNTIGAVFGRTDKVLKESKNPYSATLPIEKGEGKALFIMENRKVQKEGRDVKSAPDEIKPLIKFYYDLLHELNVGEENNVAEVGDGNVEDML